MLADTWYLFCKYMKITFRMPMWTLFTLVQPLIWLIIFGQLFRNMTQLPGFPPGSYMDFFVPGVLIMTVLFGSSWSGVSLLREIQSGTVDKMLVSPVSRVAIVLSRVLHSTAQVVVQVLIMLIVAWALGGELNINPLYYSVEAVRAVLVGTPDLAVFGTAVAILTFFTAAALWWAVASFNALRHCTTRMREIKKGL